MMRYTLQRATITLMLVLITISGISVSAAQTEPLQPQYTGLLDTNPSLTISSGTIFCEDSITIKTGYTADVTWELLGGTGKLAPITTWTASGSRLLQLNKTRVAISGYSYRLKTNVKVYNSTGKLVDDVTKFSVTVSY